jgi:hypothetical protein
VSDWHGLGGPRPESVYLGYSDDATPPLVAASPVPPVVPDSEVLDHCRCADVSMAADPDCVIHGSSGSGVVPDKPALAPEKCPVCFGTGVQHCGMSGANCRAGDDGPGGNCGQPCACRNASVPAVTDDEAATIHEVVANGLHAEACAYDHPRSECKWFYESAAREVIAALRSAGFLIVHHTKET